MTSSEDLLLFTGLGPVNSLSYLAFILGCVCRGFNSSALTLLCGSLSVALGGFVLTLGHLFQTSGRNGTKHFEALDDERGGKYVVEESDDEETNLRGGDEIYELEGPSRTVDSDDEIR